MSARLPQANGVPGLQAPAIATTPITKLIAVQHGQVELLVDWSTTQPAVIYQIHEEMLGATIRPSPAELGFWRQLFPQFAELDVAVLLVDVPVVDLRTGIAFPRGISRNRL